jgi:hypothetical protein
MKEAAEAAEAEADAEAERIAAAPAAAAPRQPDLDEPRAADASHTPDQAGEDDD